MFCHGKILKDHFSSRVIFSGILLTAKQLNVLFQMIILSDLIPTSICFIIRGRKGIHLLVTKTAFIDDLKANYIELDRKGASVLQKKFYLAPYEWYNSVIASWTADLGIKLINLSPGSGTNADYTTPDMKNYQSSEVLLNDLKRFEASAKNGLNGAFLLIHLGTAPERTDKFYNKLEEIIQFISC